MKRARWRLIAGFGLPAMMLAVLVMTGRAQLTTDIFALLPEAQRDPLAAAAMAQSRETFFREISVVITAPQEDSAAAVDAAHALIGLLRNLPLVVREAGEQTAALRDALYPHRFRLLTPADRDALRADPEAFRQRVLANLARPGNFDTADPGGFLERFLAELPRAGDEWTLLRGLPVRRTGDNIHVVVNARLTASPLEPDVQREVEAVFATARQMLKSECASCTLEWTGAIRFSQATRQAAERDIALLGSIALAGITLLFLFGFRSLRPLLAGFLVLLVSVLAGLAASFAAFGTVHVLTLVFGTTLIGLCIDYLLHFLVHRWTHPHHSAAHALQAVAPGLALGLASSSMAFLFLLFAGFPALNQLAVFSAAGLGMAWLLVNYWLPDAVVPGDGNNPLTRWQARAPRMPARVRPVLLAVLGVAGLAGLPQLKIVDDVRGLQAVPDELAVSDAKVRNAMQGAPGNTGSADFFLVEATSLDAALETERRLLDAADRTAPRFGLSQFLPSLSEQERNLAAWSGLFEETSLLRETLGELGFRAAAVDQLVEAFRQDSAASDVSGQLLASPAFGELAWLRAEDGGNVGLITRIGGLNEVPADIDNVRMVRPLQEIETAFGAIRQRAVLMVAAAYLLMLMMLSLRYGMIGGLRALAPTCFGALVALGLLGLSGFALNIFSLVALILVLGIGADYALFLREGSTHYRTVRIATAMAAMTSLLSFGLLVLGSLPALQAFGFATATGILAAWLAAPLAVPPALSVEPATSVAAAGEF